MLGFPPRRVRPSEVVVRRRGGGVRPVLGFPPLSRWPSEGGVGAEKKTPLPSGHPLPCDTREGVKVPGYA